MEFPVLISDVAIEKLIDARAADEEIDESHAIRISCRNGGCAGFRQAQDIVCTLVRRRRRAAGEIGARHIL